MVNLYGDWVHLMCGGMKLHVGDSDYAPVAPVRSHAQTTPERHPSDTRAMGQYASTHRSVNRFHNLGPKHWTLRRGFFADIGVMVLRPRESTLFVVNEGQVAYLVGKNHAECPNITAEEL
jgi:hypothetical protein